jgi:hypothetical protein
MLDDDHPVGHLDERLLVAGLLGIYIERRAAGVPHQALTLLAVARAAGPHLERGLVRLMVFYERHHRAH